MYTLRRVTISNEEINIYLGRSYTVTHKQWSSESFEKDYKTLFDAQSETHSKCYAFVHYDGNIQPLYESEGNFIMTENGKTFNNLSYK